MIIDNRSYWSKTGYFSGCQLKKVNSNKFLFQNKVILSQNNVTKKVQDNMKWFKTCENVFFYQNFYMQKKNVDKKSQ